MHRSKGNRAGAVGHAVTTQKELGDADHDKSASGIDQRRKPIRHCAGGGSPRLELARVDRHSKASALSACEMPSQRLGRLVGE